MLYLLVLFVSLLLTSPAIAAFPTVAASTTSQEEAANVTDHVISLPSSISFGDLLIVVMCVDGTSSGGVFVTWPSEGTDWIEIISQNSSQNTGSPVMMSVGYRFATGDEGSSITATTTNAQRSSHIAYRITGYQASPEKSNTGTDTALSTSVDPPSLSPSWGSDDTLWIAAGCADNAAVLPAPTFPANYTSNQLSTGTASSSGKSMAATRELSAASEDPGAFTIGTAAQRVAATIAVRPASAAPACSSRKTLLGAGPC